MHSLKAPGGNHLVVHDRPQMPNFTARQRRARVPVGRPMPRTWWPPADDPLPALAVCLGAPVAAGAIAAALLFR